MNTDILESEGKVLEKTSSPRKIELALMNILDEILPYTYTSSMSDVYLSEDRGVTWKNEEGCDIILTIQVQ